MEKRTYQQLSKTQWETEDRANLEKINAGSLQRIADATELMASNYLQLQRDLALYKRWYEETNERNKKMAKQIAAYQGHINRLKKSIKTVVYSDTE